MPQYLTPFFFYNLIITGTCCILAGIALYNVRRFARMPATCNQQFDTLVSILVPARNEERCIEECVRSLCTQRYPHVEVFVLNDGSTDSTGDILLRLQAEFQNLTVLQGKQLPEGWVGKPWACSQLAEAAHGNWLLFTDADTIHQPTMVESALQMSINNNLDFFSMIPTEILGSFAEHVVIPMVHVLYFAYLPNDVITTSKRVSISAANGQFMWFRAEAYRSIGGHSSVHNNIVEDVFLAKTAKRYGLRTALVDGSQQVSCRMYTSSAEVIAGFSKNLFPGTGYNLPITILFLLHVATVYFVPVVLAIYILVSTWPPFHPIIGVLVALQLLCSGVIRYIILRRFRMPWWHIFLQPITAVYTIIIGVNSIVWAYSSKGSQWKGRNYVKPQP